MSTNDLQTEVKRYHPSAKCEECPLYEEKTYVPSVKPDGAKIAFVGEAPGLNEVKTGEPFTGASGELLNILLGHSNIKRQEVMITNVCLCRPRSNANPPAAAIRACEPRLDEELSEAGVETIVTLGNFATKSILETSEGITKVRVGPPKRSDRYPGTRIIPTFHPAASLYNADTFPDIVTDFGKIKVDYVGQTDWQPPEIAIFDDPVDAIRALLELDSAERYPDVAIDIEVGIEKDVDFDHPDRYRMLCVGISYRIGAAIVIGENACRSPGVRSALGQLLRNKGVIAQNGKFDLAGLRAFTGVQGKLVFDTMLAHYCLDERRGTHSLDQLAIEYLGSPDWKKEIKRYTDSDGNFANVPCDILYRYNAYDVANTFHLKVVLEQMLRSEGLEDLHTFLLDTSESLQIMERYGVQVDEDYLELLEHEYGTILGHLKHELSPWVENPNSWQQVKHALKEMGLKRVPSTDKDHLESYRETAIKKVAKKPSQQEIVDFITLMLEWRTEQKRYGTYVKGTKKRVHEGRVYPTFLIHGTVSGRLSSRNPNIQNVPRLPRIRRLFVPSTPEHRLIQADYGQAELRVVCWLARDAYLREVFSDPDRDLHGEVATRFYGPNWTKEQRVRAKAVVFGLTYGREAFSLAAEHNMTVAEAQYYIETFFSVIPDTVRWIEKEVEAKVLDGQDLVTPFGRHRRFWLISNANRRNVLKEARSFLPQSIASDLTLKSANRLRNLGYGEYLRFPVHDALVAEAPQGEAEEIGQVIKEVMEETGDWLFQGYIPLPVEVKIGTNWGELE